MKSYSARVKVKEHFKRSFGYTGHMLIKFCLRHKIISSMQFGFQRQPKCDNIAIEMQVYFLKIHTQCQYPIFPDYSGAWYEIIK